MSDQTYTKQYYSLIKRLQTAGCQHPRKVFWFCPTCWKMHRTTQIAAMREALKTITA